MREEVETVRWLQDETKSSRIIPLVEAETIVRSLSVAMHGERGIVLPLLQLKDFDQYTTTHSLNVAVLAMALAEFLELGDRQVRSVRPGRVAPRHREDPHSARRPDQARQALG